MNEPTGQKIKNHSWIWTIIIVIAGVFISQSFLSGCLTSTSLAREITLKVSGVSYEYGFFKATAIATNTGDADIFSPSITLQVWDSENKVKLAETTSWPAGTLFKNFEPGESAAAEFIVSVPGGPSQVKYKFLCDDARLKVTKP